MPSDPTNLTDLVSLLTETSSALGIPLPGADVILRRVTDLSSQGQLNKALASLRRREEAAAIFQDAIEASSLAAESVQTTELLTRILLTVEKMAAGAGYLGSDPPPGEFDAANPRADQVGRVSVTDGAVHFAPVTGVSEEKYKRNGQFGVAVTLQLAIGPWNVSLIGVEGVYYAEERACYSGQPAVSMDGIDLPFLGDFMRLQNPPFLRRDRVIHLSYARRLRPPRPDECPGDCDNGELEMNVLVGVGRPAVEVRLPTARFKYNGGRAWAAAGP